MTGKERKTQGQKKGGSRVLETYGAAYLRKMGTLGGMTTLQRHGPDFFRKIRAIAEANRQARKRAEADGANEPK